MTNPIRWKKSFSLGLAEGTGGCMLKPMLASRLPHFLFTSTDSAKPLLQHSGPAHLRSQLSSCPRPGYSCWSHSSLSPLLAPSSLLLCTVLLLLFSLVWQTALAMSSLFLFLCSGFSHMPLDTLSYCRVAMLAVSLLNSSHTKALPKQT